MSRARKFSLFLMLVTTLLALLMPLPARASEIEQLLALLVKKHLVTQQEAETLREEIQAEEAAQWEAVFKVDAYNPDRRADRESTNTYVLGINRYVGKWVKLQGNFGLVNEEARHDLTSLVLSQVQFQF